MEREPTTEQPWLPSYDSETALAYVGPAVAFWSPAAPAFGDDDIFFDRFQFVEDTFPPELTFIAPESGALIGSARPELQLTYSDRGIGVDVTTLTFQVDGQSSDFICQFSDGMARCQPEQALPDGQRDVSATISDFGGLISSPATLSLEIDTWVPPGIDPALLAFLETPDTLTISGSLDGLRPGALIEAINIASGERVVVTIGADGSFELTLSAEAGDTVELRLLSAAGNAGEVYAYYFDLPPDPGETAPEEGDESGSFPGDIGFLYQPPDPVQIGLDPTLLDPERVAVVRGRVIDRDGEPLPGARVSVKGEPALGYTFSRADGWFDLVVNGGGLVILDYQKGGYLPAQRSLSVRWNDYNVAPVAGMIRRAAEATVISLGSDEPQLAIGAVEADKTGARQPSVYFPPDVQAQIYNAQGELVDVDELTVRFSEYTVGDHGPLTMPAPLPANSAYTYAVEISVDEAQGRKVDGRDVLFDSPVALHVDNFMGYPVGGGVPTGYYDSDASAWVAVPDGIVAEVLAGGAGTLTLDLTGDGVAATPAELAAWNISDAELAQLAERFEPGDSFWRVQIDHFSTWDCNWPFGPDDDAIPPDSDVTIDDGDEDDPCIVDGCDINAFTQAVSQNLNIPGMPGGSLGHDSQLVAGASGAGPGLNIRLTPADLPDSLKRVVLEVEFLGNVLFQEFPPLPNLTTRVPLVLLDPYFRERDGSFPVEVRIGYVYRPVPRGSGGGGGGGGFGRPGGVPITGDRERFEVTLWWDWEDTLVLKSAEESRETMSWRLPFQHVLEVETGTLYLGTGRRVSLFERPEIIRTLAGSSTAGVGENGDPVLGATLNDPADVAFDAAGRLYIADRGNHRIVRVDRLGNLEVVAGTGNAGDSGDNGPADQAELHSPSALVVLPDGRLAVADTGNHRIRVIDEDGIITPWVGTGTQGFGGDGGPAGSAQLDSPADIAADATGYLYIADTGNDRLRVVLPGGLIETWAGAGTSRTAFGRDDRDANRARSFQFNAPDGVAVDADGNVFVAEGQAHRIWRLPPDGSIELAAGTGQSDYNGENIPAAQANITVSAIGLDRSGQLLIADGGNQRIRKVDSNGLIFTVAGNGTSGYAAESSIALRAALAAPRAVTVTPDNLLVFAQPNAVRRVARPFPTANANQYVVPGPAGELLHVFDRGGRHLATRDALTGSTLYTLQYDGQRRIISMTDAFGNVTTLERDAVGHPAALISPYGLRTEFAVDPQGRLESITTPEGLVTAYAYDQDGLLLSKTDARGHRWDYGYDADGRLISDDFPDGGGWVINRRDFGTSWEVDFTTRMGRTTTYGMDKHPNGSETRTVTRPDGTQSIEWIGPARDRVVTRPDGTEIRTIRGGDPRFGVQVERDVLTTIRSPSGLEMSISEEVSAAPPFAVTPEEIQQWTQIDRINGRPYTTVFDQQDRTITATTPAGRSLTYHVDDLRRPVLLEQPDLAPWALHYDGRGRLVEVTQVDGVDERRVFFTYDSKGILDTVTDALGRVTDLDTDLDGRLLGAQLPGLGALSFDVDPNGNLTELITPAGQAHGFSYDEMDREIEYRSPVVGTEPNRTEAAFNLDGQLTDYRVPGDSSLSFGYDAAGRLTSQSRPVLDGDGGNEVSVAYQYDGFLLTQQSFSGSVQGQVDYHYDEDFRIVGLDVAGVETDYLYDADSLLIGATTAGQSLAFTHHPGNGLLTGSSTGPVQEVWDYNAFAETANHRVDIDGQPVFEIVYDRDALGRITHKTETLDGLTTQFQYDYDPAGRLERVWIDGQIDEEYVYDANCNRLQRNQSGQIVETAGYDAQDRMQFYGNCSYQYTANGELQLKQCPEGDTLYVYSLLGDLTQVLLPDGRQIEYVVDGRGRRVGKRVDGAVVQQLIYADQLNPVAELDGAGNVVAVFSYSQRGHVPSMMHRGGQTYRIITDHLGSVRRVIDLSDGSIVQARDYDAWGNVTLDTNPGFQPFGFAGGLEDQDTGLIRFGARDYDPQTGRWTSKDLMGFSAGDTNLYGYVWNDPINFIDPTGFCPETSRGFFDYLLVTAEILVPGWDLGACAIQGGCSAVDWGIGVAGVIPIGKLLKAAKPLGITRGGDDFFEGTRYTDKVERQMRSGDFHGFPRSVEGFQDSGRVSDLRGGDGVMRQRLEIPGSYRGRDGNFEFIKSPDGTINHRFFRPNDE